MDDIMSLKKQLSENDFEIRSLKNTLTENIKLIKMEVESWTKMGIISKEQEDLINNLSVEQVETGNISQFKEIFEGLHEIVNKFDSSTKDLEAQLKAIENM